MTWFLIAFLATFIFSVSNYVDKYLLSKHFPEKGEGALILYSTLFTLVILPFIFIIEPNVLSVSVSSIAVLLSGGIIASISILLYLKALSVNDTSTVVPFLQLIPVFGYSLGYFILHESLSVNQILAGIFIIFGSVLLSLNFGASEKIKFKTKLFYLMFIAPLLTALAQVMYKQAAIGESFVASIFWSFSGFAIFGIFLYIISRNYRAQFINTFRAGKTVLVMNCLNEFMTIVGDIGILYALLLAPAALVMIVGSYQPLIVLILGIMLTLFFPKIIKEKLSVQHLGQKFIAIVIIIVGSYLLIV
ncbi:MAG: hypothetical protein A3G52_04510 [Candidatus Taylorbacteria bacterium RIFCSPLOWO2_12_FULL_43_20]|uniref:EamA domain-containing protein n=1 Tax=Candidatus Taylorbacteria bacterium RIFCSPLOWO2_12_FULL_43_20 TaxID=1802332 RepID=A0A1G2NZ39_9BACT|nr:MAG: hypothetical protein A2825_00460 [Candidatus Taylorbacteria bacterium RIFCSPHIGHO2_01_FULL_43_120]OHA24009.1 MAG: hypothetical protein A3B98_00930 [Candidatus Taylorbacteria bacterium RIFCSPHIGHO2_02_FULL_43_55]OHA30464.1 MAG: hypothetical protein A3E92_02230 [Candidatus Taylorbacteria bacterium RIFCSPHIGHO2_12_FULL_42_34]OHA32128.1 MAG: hypothetical protein A3B09_00075 [Candidatus Taylorbacteria bacterium RIFCSPLOWO2_01_FULL_43_83]OHA39917.1 MAG: hypothetical protein A3H58_02245 [Candi